LKNRILSRLNQNQQLALIQFIKFGLVGGLNTGISYGITNACFYLFGMNKDLSNFIAWVITVFISLMLNRRFVFVQSDSEKQPFWKSLIKVYAAYSVSFLFITFLTALEEDVLGIPHYLAQLINIPISIPINFFLNKFWAYRSHKNALQTSEQEI